MTLQQDKCPPEENNYIHIYEHGQFEYTRTMSLPIQSQNSWRTKREWVEWPGYDKRHLVSSHMQVGQTYPAQLEQNIQPIIDGSIPVIPLQPKKIIVGVVKSTTFFLNF